MNFTPLCLFAKREVTEPFKAQDVLNKIGSEYRIASIDEFNVDKIEEYPDNEKIIICKLMRYRDDSIIVHDTRAMAGKLTYYGVFSEGFLQYDYKNVRHIIGCLYEPS